MELYVRELEPLLYRRSAGKYEAKGFRGAMFCSHNGRVQLNVSDQISTLGGSGAFSEDEALLQLLSGHLERLEGFSYDRVESTKRRFTVLRAVAAAERAGRNGFYIKIDDSPSYATCGKEHLTEREIELMNEAFAVVVEALE